jgi:quinolinate synthase
MTTANLNQAESPCQAALEESRAARALPVTPDIPLCQSDLPLDWYQPEFRPYAEEYFGLPDHEADTVLLWLDGYVRPALEALGERTLLLAHYYMGGEIVRLVEHYGGHIADSYQLALKAREHPEKTVIVESAVHFMAESIALLGREEQQVWITNPKAGCTMELWAKEHMVRPVVEALQRHYGDLVVVTYMNTSGRLKALAGQTGGAVCTSSNAEQVVGWALSTGKRVFFVPDRHLGWNVARGVGLDPASVVELDSPRNGPVHLPDALSLERARLILWGSECGVHTVFTPDLVHWWRGRDWTVIVHPESPAETVALADGAGSTAYLWKTIMNAPRGAKFAVGTEGHFVRHAAERAAHRGVKVRHLADVPNRPTAGCGCATMSRNDPPHLAAMMDLLRRGRAPEINRVLPGDIVDESTMERDRLSAQARADLARDARAALVRMIEITEGRLP